MKFTHTASLLLALFASACVTPSASVTDLTKKNRTNAEALRDAHEASLVSMDRFIAGVEVAELAYLKEARTKIERLTSQALRSRLEALGARYRSRFDDGLWKLRGEDFDELVQREFRDPLNLALAKDSKAVFALFDQSQKYPGDVPLRKDYESALKANEMAKLSVDQEERDLELEAARVTSTARMKFSASLEASLDHYHLLLRGLNENSDNSYASILSAVEIERVEPRPISYSAHREALQEWSEESSARLESHVAALEAADRYLRGKKLSFLFVEGSEALSPLDLPEVPAVNSLGLGDALVELRAREAALAGLESKLEDAIARELGKIRDALSAEVRLKRSELEERMSFLEMPR